MTVRSHAAFFMLLATVMICLLATPSAAQPSQKVPQTYASSGYLTEAEYALLEEMFAVHLNLFMSEGLITSSGIPLTAYKVGDRARYGWSNPTEWGYAIQAWIAAAERGLITKAEAAAKIKTTIETMQALQQKPDQNYRGMFYPFYTVVAADGTDLPAPIHDDNHEIPSGDLALLYASLTVAEGWGIKIDDSALLSKIRGVKDKMDFGMFLVQEGENLYLAHLINADTEKLSTSRWDIYADEGGVVAWVFYLSGSGTLEEFMALTRSQSRKPASWVSCQDKSFTVNEAAWFNAMFPWGVRSLAGFPIGAFDTPVAASPRYSKLSFVPTVEAHLAYGDCLGVDYPAFSDAMTQSEGGQGLVGRYTPPNLADQALDEPPVHVMPHAYFVSLLALPDLSSETKTRLFDEIEDLRGDAAGYYHDSGQYPYGFEVVASPYRNDTGYDGADGDRLIFETLSHSYVALSLFNILQLEDEARLFSDFAALVPDYGADLRAVLNYLYPTVYLPVVAGPWIYVREAEFPDLATVGQTVMRSNASGQQAHGQFGSESAAPWSKKAGYVAYVDIDAPDTGQLMLEVRYSKNSDSSAAIDVYLDQEATPRATFFPEDQGSWDHFAVTGPIDLGKVSNGVHTIKFSTAVGQRFGIADLDKFTLSAAMSGTNQALDPAAHE